MCRQCRCSLPTASRNLHTANRNLATANLSLPTANRNLATVNRSLHTVSLLRHPRLGTASRDTLSSLRTDSLCKMTDRRREKDE